MTVTHARGQDSQAGAGQAAGQRTPPLPPYADSLARELRRAVSWEVRFSPGARVLYAYDASIFRQVPIGVAPEAAEPDPASQTGLAANHLPIKVLAGAGAVAAGAVIAAAVRRPAR